MSSDEKDDGFRLTAALGSKYADTSCSCATITSTIILPMRAGGVVRDLGPDERTTRHATPPPGGVFLFQAKDYGLLKVGRVDSCGHSGCTERRSADGGLHERRGVRAHQTNRLRDLL